MIPFRFSGTVYGSMRKLFLFVKEKFRKNETVSYNPTFRIRQKRMSHHAQVNVVLAKKLSKLGRWLLIRKEVVGLRYVPESDHRVPTEL